MDNRKIYQDKSFTIYASTVGAEHVYLVASVKDNNSDPIATCREIYIRLANIIKELEISIVEEKLFGSNSLQKEILKVREEVLRNSGVYEELPITYIQGQPIWGSGFSGLQIYAVKSSQLRNNVWTIYEDDVPCGRGINRNGATFLSLQNIHGIGTKRPGDIDRKEQTGRMLDRIDKLLQKNGAVYKDVLCTRIYISDILDWYDDFNKARNAKYTEYGIIPSKSEAMVTEQIYLPSSTGIQADNPDGAAAVMNVLAVVKEPDSQPVIEHNNGVKQKSAFRYGSAFSRSTIIRETDNRCILISGTAAIDEQGKSLFPGNAREQIIKTFEIVDALIKKENASFKDICMATVFLKRPEDISIYRKVAHEYGLTDMPAVCVIADVCRDELLFEIDAVVAVENV